MTARLLKDPSTAGSRIFVGHLQTDDMNKAELEEHFTKYGKVVGSLINRGFGFVQFENDEAARNAIQKEDGAMFKGRRIGELLDACSQSVRTSVENVLRLLGEFVRL